MTVTEGQATLTPIQMAWLQELGLDRRLLHVAFKATESPVAPPPALQRMPDQSVPVSHKPLVTPAPALPMAKRIPIAPLEVALPDDLSLLKVEVEGCQRCGLHAERHQAVFGNGETEGPDWMVIGEAPGDQDDQLGLPFQGPAGRLLGLIFDAAGLSTNATFYYANVLKCRPRGGRVPRKEEIAACLPYMQAQINQIRPKGILALGWLAAQALLQEKGSIEQLREQTHSYAAQHGLIPVVVTYHPAALLLRGRHKAQVWRDMLMAKTLERTKPPDA